MSYLNDPNTHRLATRCCACGRSLRDSKSVEIGMGPHCRKKYGFSDVYNALTDRQRKNVNKLIHMAGAAAEDDDIRKVLACADKMDNYGFKHAAKQVRSRFITIRINKVRNAEVFRWARQESGGWGETPDGKATILRLWLPYSPRFNQVRKDNRLRARPCKVNTDHGKFHWEVREDDGVLLMRVLAIVFPGRAFIMESGKVATIPTRTEFNKDYAGHGVDKIAKGDC